MKNTQLTGNVILKQAQQGPATFLPNNSVGTNQLQTGAVTSTNLATGAVTNPSIAPGAVANSNLAPGLQLGTVTLTPVANAVNLSLATGNSFYCSVPTASTLTVNLSNFLDGQVAMLAVNANTHAVTVVFSPALTWAGGTQPAQTTGTDIYTILYNATSGRYYASATQSY